MKRAILERNIVVVLFVLVLIVFSFAERDTQKLNQLYNGGTVSSASAKKEKSLASSEQPKVRFFNRITRN